MTSKDLEVAPSSAVEEFMAEFGASVPLGLESIGSDDIALANIKIDHAKAVFVDSLTGETFTELDGALLGAFKQRVLWSDNLEEKNGPMCKSSDGALGSPREHFPWEVYHQHGGQEVAGAPTIACGSCSLAKWGTNPKNDTPWCSQQYTFPYVRRGEDRVAGLLTFARSGIKPTQAYMSGFIRDGLPLFTYYTKITLNQNKTGSVYWCQPKFERSDRVESVELLRAWAAAYKEVKQFITGKDLGGDSVFVTEGSGSAPF